MSVFAAVFAGGHAASTDDNLTDRVTCYTANDTTYQDCLKARADGRSAGQGLRPPMVTPFRVSLCATLQYRFSWEEFWECAKALSDPRR